MHVHFSYTCQLTHAPFLDRLERHVYLWGKLRARTKATRNTKQTKVSPTVILPQITIRRHPPEHPKRTFRRTLIAPPAQSQQPGPFTFPDQNISTRFFPKRNFFQTPPSAAQSDTLHAITILARITPQIIPPTRTEHFARSIRVAQTKMFSDLLS